MIFSVQICLENQYVVKLEKICRKSSSESYILLFGRLLVEAICLHFEHGVEFVKSRTGTQII
jgi:hypothetical protein